MSCPFSLSCSGPHRRSQPCDVTAARLASRSHGTCTGDYGGRHRRVRPPPRGTLSTTTTTYLLLLGPPALRLHPWREGGIFVVTAILLWFIPVLVFLYPYRIVFGGGGSHACLESSPLIGQPWLLAFIRPSGRTPISTRAPTPFLSHSSFDEGMWFPLDTFGRPVFLYMLSMEIPLR